MTTVYVVVETDWQYNDENFYQPEGSPGYVRGVFATRAAAEADAVRQAVRDTFKVEDVFEFSNNEYDPWWDSSFIMPWYAWRDWVRDRGVTPPELSTDPDADTDVPTWNDKGRAEWLAWWKKNGPGLTPDQQQAVVSTMKLDLYRVVEVDFVD